MVIISYLILAGLLSLMNHKEFIILLRLSTEISDNSIWKPPVRKEVPPKMAGLKRLFSKMISSMLIKF